MYVYFYKFGLLKMQNSYCSWFMPQLLCQLPEFQCGVHGCTCTDWFCSWNSKISWRHSAACTL